MASIGDINNLKDKDDNDLGMVPTHYFDAQGNKRNIVQLICEHSLGGYPERDIVLVFQLGAPKSRSRSVVGCSYSDPGPAQQPFIFGPVLRYSTRYSAGGPTKAKGRYQYAYPGSRS